VLEFLCSDVLRTRPRLVSLDLSHNSLALNDSEAVNLLQRQKSLNLFSLQSLDLSFNQLSDESFHSFLEMIWPLPSALSSSPLRQQQQLSRQLSTSPPALKMKQRIHLRELTISHSLIGNKSFGYLGSLLKAGRFSQLRRLSLGMNNAAGRDGIEMILTALLPHTIERLGSSEDWKSDPSEGKGDLDEGDGPKSDRGLLIADEDDWRREFKALLIPMNPLSNEGLLAIMTAGIAGALRYLEVCLPCCLSLSSSHLPS
jgi:hypothetical protein